MYILTIAKLVATVSLNYLLLPNFKELGVAYSDIIVNLALVLIAIFLLWKKGIIGLKGFSFDWIKEYVKIGCFSGAQIFLDNFIYAIMICKMVNAVAASGNYWIANNFIWGWLLIPMNCLAEIIRKNKYIKLDMNNSWKYLLIFVGLWGLSVPCWEWFLGSVMGVTEISPILSILYTSVPFYVFYLISTCYSSWFISQGKTYYNTIVSFFVNIGYYGIAYILFNQGVFELNIRFVVLLLFGFGMVFNTMVSVVLYIIERKRMKKQTV